MNFLFPINQQLQKEPLWGGGGVVETINKIKKHQKRQNWRERERIDLFCDEQLGRNMGEVKMK